MPDISHLRGVAGAAGPIVSAEQAEQLRRACEGLFAQLNRAVAEALAVAVSFPTVPPAEEIGPHHRVERPLCRN
jgi:hypothetical protein